MKKVFFSLLFFASVVHAQKLHPFIQNDKYGFKKAGSEVIPARFDYACDFTYNLALVKVNGLWGFIDTLGNMKIPAIYQKAEPFKSESAFVKLNNKIGLIDTSGNYRIKPEYDEIVQRTWSEFYLNNKSGKGFYDAHKDRTVPAIYKDIEVYGLYISAKKENGKWDLYCHSKLIAEDAARPVKYGDHEDGNLLRVQKSNRTGMYKSDQKWVFEPVYVLIEKIPFPEYTASGTKFNYIYALYSMGNETADYIDQFETPALIQFAKGDGTFISENQFTNFTSLVIDRDIPCKVCIQAQSEAGSFMVDSKVNIEKMDYDWIFPHMEWYFAIQNEKYFILDNNLQPIDSFKEISRYDDIIYDYGDHVLNPDGEYDVKVVPVDSESFLIVSQQVGDSVKKAVYSLTERKVISLWFPYELELNVGRTLLGNETLYSFQGNGGKIGFYTYGMKSAAPLIYDSYEILLNNTLKVKESEGLETVFALKDNALIQLSQENLILEASKMTLNSQENLAETGNVETQFGYDFLFTHNKDGKYGLISWNHVVIDPLFDTIIPNPSNPYFVNTIRNGKYGTVNISTGDQVLPFSDTPLEFLYAEGTEQLYAQIGQGPGSYYITAQGQKFYTLNPEVIVFKEKGLYGLKSHSDFDDGKLFVLVKPAYKSMEKLPYDNSFIVKGSNKKYGVINQYGDTLVAFRYDQLEEYGYDDLELGLLLKTTVKGEFGIVSPNAGELVPAGFDAIYDFKVDEYISGVYEVKKNKKTGVYIGGSGIILPCHFDAVSSRRVNDFYVFLGELEDKLYVQSISFQENGVKKYGDLSKPYDVVSGDAGFVISGDQFLKYDLRTGQFQDTVLTTDVSYSNSHFTLVSKNGKWGAFDFYGNELVPFIYDSGQFMDYREEVMIGFENGIKYYIYVDNNQRYTENEW